MSTCRLIASAVLLTVLGACDGSASSETGSTAAAQPAGAAGSAPPPQAPADASAAAEAMREEDRSAAGPAAGAVPPFAGKVWRVVASDGVQAGTTYAFLADGTLVIEAPGGNPPGYARWRVGEGRLTIEEEGVAYPTDIVRNDADRLALRSHNPAGALDIELERLPDAALPQAP